MEIEGKINTKMESNSKYKINFAPPNPPSPTQTFPPQRGSKIGTCFAQNFRRSAMPTIFSQHFNNKYILDGKLLLIII